MADLSITVRTVHNALIVDLAGEVDLYNAPRLQDFLKAKLAQEGADVVLNLTDVEYIDSAGLGILVQALKLAQTSHSSIRLMCPNEMILRVLTVTGLTRVFTIYADEAQALSVAKMRSETE